MKFLMLASFFLFSFSLLIQSQAARPIRGYYEVPTTDELKPVAQISVRFKSDNYEGLGTQIEFPLPQELTGLPQTIVMKKTEGNLWSGPQMNGECSIQDRNFICAMKFHSLNCSAMLAKRFIETKYPQAEVGQRMLLAEQFCGEPIGILSYKLRGRDK